MPEERGARFNEQQSVLKPKHDDHVWPRLPEDSIHTVAKHHRVVYDRKYQRRGEAGVEEDFVGRGGLLLDKLDATSANPLPYLASNEADKHNEKPYAHIISEYGHSQECLGYGEPGVFVKALDFHGAKGSIEETLESIHEGSREKQDEVREDLQRVLASAEGVAEVREIQTIRQAFDCER